MKVERAGEVASNTAGMAGNAVFSFFINTNDYFSVGFVLAPNPFIGGEL